MRTDGRAEGHGEANSGFSHSCERAKNWQCVPPPLHTTCLFVYLEAGTVLLELRAAGVRLPAEARDARPTLGPTQPPVQSVGRPGLEAAHPPRVLARLRFT